MPAGVELLGNVAVKRPAVISLFEYVPILVGILRPHPVVRIVLNLLGAGCLDLTW